MGTARSKISISKKFLRLRIISFFRRLASAGENPRQRSFNLSEFMGHMKI